MAHKSENDLPWFFLTICLLLIMVGAFLGNHMMESICQTEHDVADCHWVVVPVERNGKDVEE